MLCFDLFYLFVCVPVCARGCLCELCASCVYRCLLREESVRSPRTGVTSSCDVGAENRTQVPWKSRKTS